MYSIVRFREADPFSASDDITVMFRSEARMGRVLQAVPGARQRGVRDAVSGGRQQGQRRRRHQRVHHDPGDLPPRDLREPRARVQVHLRPRVPSRRGRDLQGHRRVRYAPIC